MDLGSHQAQGTVAWVLAGTDGCRRKKLCLMPDTRIASGRVARELDAPVCVHAKPTGITSDNGTGFASRAIPTQAGENHMDWHDIDPGKPRQNTVIAYVNASLRHDRSHKASAETLDNTRWHLSLWRCDAMSVRPQASSGIQTPAKSRRDEMTTAGQFQGCGFPVSADKVSTPAPHIREKKRTAQAAH